MGVELTSVKAMLDQPHPSLPTQRDQNSYTLGEMGGHNIVITVLPEIGTNSAATVAIQLLSDFPSVRFGLLVRIGGGVPDEEEVGNDI
jgi:nucleoside phosphorylase